MITLFAAIVTLGLFPAMTRSYGVIEFEVFDTSKNEIAKVYKYPVEHRYFFGISSVVLGPIMGAFSERFDHSTNEKTFVIMRVAFKQFEEDIIKDIQSDKNFYSRFTVDKSKSTAFLMPEDESNKSKTFASILSSLEAKFIERGITVVERRRLKLIHSELKLSQLGITDSSGIEAGKLANADRIIIIFNDTMETVFKDKLKIEFSIKCLDVKSGTIIWTEKVDYTTNKAALSNDDFDKITKRIMDSLKSKGNI
ncbi:MAG: hypothetical protein SFU98_15490 [Leptospiraceae bacterium]|nr:hypothetical protein [Leptospiraceae bacterium]